MLASLVSLLCRPFRAIAGFLPSRAPTLAWGVVGGVSVAAWTAPGAGAEAGTVSSVHLEIRPSDAPRQPYVLTVRPDGYMPASFVVGDLETARSLALQQLAIARRLPAPQPAAEPAAAETMPYDAADTGMFRPVVEATAEGRDEAA